MEYAYSDAVVALLLFVATSLGSKLKDSESNAVVVVLVVYCVGCVCGGVVVFISLPVKKCFFFSFRWIFNFYNIYNGFHVVSRQDEINEIT